MYSPMFVMHIMVVMRNRPGMMIIHQLLVSNAFSDNAIMLPQDTVSTGRPNPRKLKVASVAIAVAILLIIIKKIAGMKLGIICFLIIYGKPAPMSFVDRM